MSCTIKTVSMTGTEQEFITAFVSAVTTADKHITCETDISEQFSSEENTPEITFNVNDCYKIKMKRESALSQVTNVYNFSSIINENVQKGLPIMFNNAALAKDAISARTYTFNICGSERYDAIKFYAHNYQNLLSPSFSYISIYDDTFKAVSGENLLSSSKTVETVDFICTGGDEKGETYKFTKRLAYPIADNRVEIIKNKVLIKGGHYDRTFSGFYDCSDLVRDSVVTIEGVNYYALDENTIAPIGE